jgi:predicted nucleotidyltransferase
MIGPKTISKAVELLRKGAKPRKIILFGSYARGGATARSDLDFLVIEDTVRDVAAEMVRLRRLLSPLRVPADVLVVSERQFSDWADTPGNVLHEAAVEGRVVYEAA